MKQLAFLLALTIFLFACQPPASEPYVDVEIARDKWGIPHIKGKTDKDVIYGLAWAQCEDDFVTMQEQMLASKGLLGEIKGKDGLIIDFAVKYMGLRESVNERYEAEIKGQHKLLLTTFAQAVNTYARLHPEEVLLKDGFPVTVQDLLVGYQLGLVDISGAGADLQKILENKLPGSLNQDIPKGSNAIAISGKKTENGKTFLAINSHQPLEGWYSWYEAHLHSDEGLNILGGTFPGGFMIFHGVNDHLGWAQTVNAPDLSDVYQLKMHDKNKLQYRFDGQWLTLKKKRYWSWMKIFAFIKIPIRKTIYESVYGPTFKTDQGFFSWRFAASKHMRMGEQWFAMNKATNFEEFKIALEIQAIASTNIVYADKEDNIFFISNATIPKRDPIYNWNAVLPGDTSATLWKEDYYSIEEIPQVTNPSSGFLFNTNNSPYNATMANDDTHPSDLQPVFHYLDESMDNNRSNRLLHLLSSVDTLSYDGFKRIKFDLQFPDTLETPHVKNLELMLDLNPDQYPDIADVIKQLNQWNRRHDVQNETAALFHRSYKALENELKKTGRFQLNGQITEADCVMAIQTAKELMMTKYGKTKIPLGDVQRHIRGNVNLALPGGPDVLAAMYAKEIEDNQYKGVAGESYIALAQFSDDGPVIETIHAYGSSAEDDSPHFTDQMELFVKQQLKPMTLDIAKVFAQADTIYHPLKLQSSAN